MRDWNNNTMYWNF